MKKIIIGIGVIAIILVAIILNRNNIYRIYRFNQLRNNFINESNGKFNDATNEISKKEYKRYHTPIEDLNHYNITELIDKYIEMAEESIEVYNKKKDGKKNIYKNYESDDGKINGPAGLEYGKDIRMEYEQLRFDIADNLTETDIKNYNNGIFKSLLIEKLKGLLDYEEINGKIEWQINSVNDMRIELPYYCYIDYKAYYRKDENIKKIVDIKIDKSFNFNENNFNKVEVRCETYDGNVKQKKVNVNYKKNNDKEYYRIPLRYIYLSEPETLASAELKSHTRDKRKEEVDRAYIEKWGKYIE